MRLLRVTLLGLAMTLAGAGLALAEVVYSKGGHPVFAFQPPEGWVLRTGPNFRPQGLPAGTPEAPPIYSLRPKGAGTTMWVGVWSPDNAHTVSQFYSRLKHLRGRILENTHMTYRDQRMVNGMPTGIWAGRGWRDGHWYDVAFAAVQIAPQELAVITFIGDRDEFDTYEKSLSDMLATVRPAVEAK